LLASRNARVDARRVEIIEIGDLVIGLAWEDIAELA
jgi:hypothetical protein